MINTRTLRNDFTVAHHKKLYQIQDKTQASRVEVQDRMDGSTKILYQNRSLNFTEITTRPRRQEKPRVKARTRRRYVPPADHPWKRFKFGSRRQERYRHFNSEQTVESSMQAEASTSSSSGRKEDDLQQRNNFSIRKGIRATGVSEELSPGEIPVALRAPSISPAPKPKPGSR